MEGTDQKVDQVKDGRDKLQRLKGLKDIMQSAIDNNRSEEAWASSIALKGALENAVAAANDEIKALETHLDSIGG